MFKLGRSGSPSNLTERIEALSTEHPHRAVELAQHPDPEVAIGALRNGKVSGLARRLVLYHVAHSNDWKVRRETTKASDLPPEYELMLSTDPHRRVAKAMDRARSSRIIDFSDLRRAA